MQQTHSLQKHAAGTVIEVYTSVIFYYSWSF
jgi:hypothetical protein